MNRIAVPFSCLALAGCDYTGDFLFTESEIEDIWILEADGGGPLVPATITNIDELRAATIYGEVGVSLTTFGGVTFDFVGTGQDVCIWVDPELAYWSQAVAARPAPGTEKWTYPDNVFDDGDLDILAGLSVYYTGSPGEEIGDFKVNYEDSLGNPVPFSLAECPNQLGLDEELGVAGRGSPEYCTIPATEIGIEYTVVLRTWSTPLDDDRLGFGLILANGKCSDSGIGGAGGGIREIAGSTNTAADECVIQGEAITPDGTNYGPFYGFDALNDGGRIWGGSTDFEASFCDVDERMQKFCKEEADRMNDGQDCDWHGPPSADSRCYCGNLNDTPTGGAI